MPPVPDKTRSGRFFGRRVMQFQNWTLASNARWRLTDHQLAILWQAEFPNSRSRYTINDQVAVVVEVLVEDGERELAAEDEVRRGARPGRGRAKDARWGLTGRRPGPRTPVSTGPRAVPHCRHPPARSARVRTGGTL